MDRLDFLTTREQRATEQPRRTLGQALAERTPVLYRIRIQYDRAGGRRFELEAWTADFKGCEAPAGVTAHSLMAAHPEINWWREHQIDATTGAVYAMPEPAEDGFLPAEDRSFGERRPPALAADCWPATVTTMPARAGGMNTATTNGTDLRALTAPEQKAVELRQRNATEAAIRIETGLSSEQVDVAVQRHASWQKLRGKAASAALVQPEYRRTVSALLTWAEASGVARAMTLAARVREQLAELRSLQEQTDARAKAQAEVDRLAAELEAAKARLKEAGGRSKPSVQTAKPDAKAERAAIRAWARMHGMEVANRGVLPDSVVTAYHAANGGEPG